MVSPREQAGVGLGPVGGVSWRLLCPAQAGMVELVELVELGKLVELMALGESLGLGP